MGIIKYSIKDILKDAKKYNNRRDWKKKSPGTYEAARPRRRNILELATKHMKRLPTSSIKKWPIEVILKDAKKFKFSSEWKKNFGGAYRIAVKLRILKEATKHMQPKPRS